MKKILFVLCLFGLVSTMGCNDLVAPDLNEYQDTELSDSDGNHDTNDVHSVDVTPDEDADTGSMSDVDDVDDVDECIPEVLQCSDTVCGPQIDNCGNPVTCLPCGCTTLDEVCGLADLGILTQCGQADDENYVKKCNIPKIPGLTEELLQESSPLLYVDKENGSDSNNGQKEAPFQSIQKALVTAQASYVVSSANDQNKVVAIIVAGDAQTVYDENSLELISGVSLIGGYDSNFKRTRHNRPTIKGNRSPAQKDESSFGLVAQDIDSETLVHNFHITTVDAAQNASAYAIYARDSDKLVLDNITTLAGKGGDGAAGSAGKDGKVGANGQNSTSSKPGLGGKNENCAPVHSQGGHGGSGQVVIGLSPKEAQPGNPAKIAKGGAASALNGYGGDGENAPPQEYLAENGQSGLSGGEVAENKWMPSGHGTEAQEGSHGTGGGGGGGGAKIGSLSDGYAGGGGGAGGCAGTGGGAGKAGGGSFGLFLVDSDIEIKSSIFKANSGGKGGNGGKGGRGGSGGKGGKSAQDKTPYGGKGGDGSNGSAGGHGGAGAGGVSYGAYCHESAPKIGENVIFIAGASAPGGQGPSPEESGGAGIAEKHFGCD